MGSASSLPWQGLDLYLRFTGGIPVSEYAYDEEKGMGFRDAGPMVIFNEGFTIKSPDPDGLMNDQASVDPGLPTIFLYGDSYVLADQVFERHHFGTVLRNRLSETMTEEIQLLNLGYNGSELTDIYLKKRYHGDELARGLSLIFLEEEDLIPLSGDPFLPALEMTDSGLQRVLNVSPGMIASNRRNAILKQHSTLVNLVSRAMVHYATNGIMSAILGKFWPTEASGHGHTSREVTDLDPLIPLILNELDPRRTLIIYKGEGATPEVFRKIMTEYGVEVVSLNAVFDQMKSEGINPKYWKGTQMTGHWNYEAHQEIGKYLADEINRLIESGTLTL